MSVHSSLRMLVAQLQLREERLTSVLVTSPEESESVQSVARTIAGDLRACGVPSRFLALSASSDATPVSTGSDGVILETISKAEASSPEGALAIVMTSGGMTVVSAPAVLREPSALFLAAAAGSVILVADRGRTSRQSLRDARAEIHAAGARLVGAIFIEG